MCVRVCVCARLGVLAVQAREQRESAATVAALTRDKVCSTPFAWGCCGGLSVTVRGNWCVLSCSSVSVSLCLCLLSVFVVCCLLSVSLLSVSVSVSVSVPLLDRRRPWQKATQP